MATSLTEERLLELKETFSMFDKDMNGSISIEELTQVQMIENKNILNFGPGAESDGSKANKGGGEGHDWGGRYRWKRDN